LLCFSSGYEKISALFRPPAVWGDRVMADCTKWKVFCWWKLEPCCCFPSGGFSSLRGRSVPWK
jgi:hypothetical protein